MRPKLPSRTGFQLAVTVLLAIVPFISATPSSSQLSQRGLDSVNQPRGVTLPAGWRLVDPPCYPDDPNQPILTSIAFTDDGMTIEFCVNVCATASFTFAALENGNGCFCGNLTTNGAEQVSISPSGCQSPCVGNLNEYCGGPNNLNLYWNGNAPQPDPNFVKSVGVWNLLGCYSDSNDARTLNNRTSVGEGDSEKGLTVENCVAACGSGGYSYAGVEWAQECWCGNSINPSGTAIDSGNCSVLACSGDSLEYCGANHTMIIYKLPPP